MDFYKEAEEFKKIWSERTPFGKLILIVALALSFISVGSLADTVYSFKGFIVYGLEFYRDISEPILTRLSNLLNIGITQFHLDNLVLFSIWMASSFRTDFSETEMHKGFRWVVGVLATVTIFVLLNRLMEPFFGRTVALLICFPITNFITGLCTNKPMKVTAANRVGFYYFISIYFSVAFVAAISAGLAKPLDV